MKYLAALCFLPLLATGCAPGSGVPPRSGDPALTRMGGHHFKVTTASPEAQACLDRGLTWAYSFGYHAAEQEFRRASAMDPDCAMAYWGVALVNGPHINFPMVPPDRAAKAWEAITRARELAPRASPREQVLIAALATRYSNPQPGDRTPLDEAYAEAMRGLWKQFPGDADIGALCAEALMDLHPWDLWVDGQARPWTPEIVTILERALQLNPRHPALNHYYIHALEASREPGKALVAAHRLRKLVPDSGHMVHMPSHIFTRVGDWPRAAEANQEAMKADARYREVYPRPGFYAMYMAHNAHFLAFAAMMRGRNEETVAVARRLVAEIPEDFVADFGPVADGFLVFVPEALMRFGRWQESLQEPKPRGNLPFSQAMWRWTRAVAFTGLDRMAEARAERELFLGAMQAVPAEAFHGNNSASDLLEVAVRVLDGEMLAQEGRLAEAVPVLEAAVRREDKLRYDEPPDWILPVRHTLGAVLLRTGRAAEAEKVYQADLAMWPENGWSLMGLRDSLKAQGRAKEAQVADARLRKAWAEADIQPSASCYCQAGKIGAR
jgi:tetratricopeptide (TPR) repeat protein